MANCQGCGTKLGMGRTGVCASCSERQKRERAQAEQSERVNYDAKVDGYVTHVVEQMDRLIATGATAYVYKEEFLEVDSLFEQMGDAQGLDLFDLVTSGAAGWEVVATIPRTYSGSQTYVSKNKMTATSFGGGSTTQRVSLSGNVVGAYLLMRLPVTSETRALHDGTIRAALKVAVTKRNGPRP